jgi:hypothetical protein
MMQDARTIEENRKAQEFAALDMKNDEARQTDEGRETEKAKFAPLSKSRKDAAKQKMMQDAREIEEKRKAQEFAALVNELEEPYGSSLEQEDIYDDNTQEWGDVSDDTKTLADERDDALFDEQPDETDQQEEYDGNDRMDHDQACPGMGEQSSGNNEAPVSLYPLLRMDMSTVRLIYL